MSYPGGLGMMGAGYQLPNGVGTPAQLATVLRLFGEDAAAADMGNVPAKYASMVLLPDGSLTTNTAALVPDPGADWQPAYLAQVVNARRYLLIAVPRVMSTGNTANWFTTIGAIGAPAATAILQTYTPSGKPTTQTAAVEAAVQTGGSPVTAQPIFSAPESAALAPPSSAPGPATATPSPVPSAPIIDTIIGAPPNGGGPTEPMGPEATVPASSSPASVFATVPASVWIGAAAVLGGYLLFRRAR